jgi:hypothetical protein
MVNKRPNALDKGKQGGGAAQAQVAAAGGRAAPAPDIDVRKLTVRSKLTFLVLF